jgi:magnesium chelatase subunit I
MTATTGTQHLAIHPKPRTLGELKRIPDFDARTASRSVKNEIRQNLLRAIKNDEPLFPGVHGYEDTVVPQIVNALLSRHNFILLGLRGQAKSRILRGLVGLLDPEIPVVAGCEINDDPLHPICRACREKIAAEGDNTPLAWMPRDNRFVEKLATPDVTIADILGDVDPIRAARGGRDLSDELTIHYGLLPRANRGIFAINELPDLAGKIQVGLFNIMQEGDVQIKGYPIRLPLDVAIAFSANPEDYTARGKIITPLKDRIGSEIRTHYPATVDEGIAITAQEAWTSRRTPGEAQAMHLPTYIQEVIERIAFAAREDKKIDKRSGVSQRLPISAMENVISNAERRALRNDENVVVPRVSDVYAALPAITGKLELEYEGEMKGADFVGRELIRAAIAKTYDEYFTGANVQQIVQWFDLGGEIQLSDSIAALEALENLKEIQGLIDKLGPLGVSQKDSPEQQVSAAEFILEGLHAHKRIGRNEERVFKAGEKKPEPVREKSFDKEEPPYRQRRQFN